MYERNPGDTWFFTVLGDRLPIGGMLAVVYFGVARTHPYLGALLFAILILAILWTAPNRWGLGIALHYLSRVYWSSPDDPLPPPEGAQPTSSSAAAASRRSSP